MLCELPQFPPQMFINTSPVAYNASAESILQRDNAPKNLQQRQHGRPKKPKQVPPQRKQPPPPPHEDLHGRVWECQIGRRWKSHSEITGKFAGEYST